MKVIEVRRDERNGGAIQNSWGNAIESDFSIIVAVTRILEMKRDQEMARAERHHNPILDRFTTTSIVIEL